MYFLDTYIFTKRDEFSCLPACGKTQRELRPEAYKKWLELNRFVVGGTPADPTAWPWMVSGSHTYPGPQLLLLHDIQRRLNNKLQSRETGIKPISSRGRSWKGRSKSYRCDDVRRLQTSPENDRHVIEVGSHSETPFEDEGMYKPITLRLIVGSIVGLLLLFLGRGWVGRGARQRE